MSVERMPLAIEKLFAFDDQWRDPRRIIRINLPLEFDEGIALTPRGHL
jgi:hypothetical protein